MLLIKAIRRNSFQTKTLRRKALQPLFLFGCTALLITGCKKREDVFLSKGQIKKEMVQPSVAPFKEKVFLTHWDSLLCFEAGNGKHLWSIKLACGYSSPAVNNLNGILYTGSSDSCLHAIGIGTGTEIWKYKTGSIVSGHPVYNDGMVYFKSEDNYLYALDAVSGLLKWSLYGGTHWTGYSDPAIYDGKLYFVTPSGYICAADAKNGLVLWMFKTAGKYRTASNPAVYNDVLTADGGDGYLYAFNTGSGRLFWTYKLEGKPAAPSADRNNILISDDRKLVAIDVRTGVKVWQRYLADIESTSPVAKDSKVFINDREGVYVIDNATNTLLAETMRHTIISSGSSTTVADVSGRKMIFIPGRDVAGKSFMFALDASTCSMIWKKPLQNGSEHNCAVVATPDQVYYAAESGAQQ